MARGASWVLNGTKAAATNAANRRGGHKIWRNESPDERKAKISLSSDSRPNVNKHASNTDMGTLRLNTVGKKSMKILADRASGTPLLINKSIKSKILSNRSTPENSESPNRKGGIN